MLWVNFALLGLLKTRHTAMFWTICRALRLGDELGGLGSRKWRVQHCVALFSMQQHKLVLIRESLDVDGSVNCLLLAVTLLVKNKANILLSDTSRWWRRRFKQWEFVQCRYTFFTSFAGNGDGSALIFARSTLTKIRFVPFSSPALKLGTIHSHNPGVFSHTCILCFTQVQRCIVRQTSVLNNYFSRLIK